MLSYMTDTSNVTYVFSHTTLLEALKEWEVEQVEHFPQQEERINLCLPLFLLF